MAIVAVVDHEDAKNHSGTINDKEIFVVPSRIW